MALELFGQKTKEKNGVNHLSQSQVEKIYNDELDCPREMREQVKTARDKLTAEATKVAGKELVNDPDTNVQKIRMGSGDGQISVTVTGRKKTNIPDGDGGTKEVTNFGSTDIRQRVRVDSEIMDPVVEELKKDCEKVFK